METRQSWIYLLCIIAGLVLGFNQHAAKARPDAAVWPILALLLCSTFTQISIIQIRSGLKDGRFLGAMLLGNFVVTPLFVWILTALLALVVFLIAASQVKSAILPARP